MCVYVFVSLNVFLTVAFAGKMLTTNLNVMACGRFYWYKIWLINEGSFNMSEQHPFHIAIHAIIYISLLCLHYHLIYIFFFRNGNDIMEHEHVHNSYSLINFIF